MGSHLSGACWPLSEKRYAGAHCGFSARSRNVTPIESATPLLFFATLRVTSRIDKLRNYQALFSARRRTRRAQVFLTPHSSPLSPRIWAVGPIRPSLVRGLRPRNAPSPKPPAAASVWQYDLDDPLRPGFTPPASWQIPSICRRRQDRRGNSHIYPTITAMTIASPLQKY